MIDRGRNSGMLSLHVPRPVVAAFLVAVSSAILAILCDGQTMTTPMPTAELASFQESGCYIPYTLFPRRLCVEINLDVQCYNDTNKAWDEECSLCIEGQGYDSMESCVDVAADEYRPPIINNTEAGEEVDVPEDIDGLRYDVTMPQGDENTTTRDSSGSCSLSLSRQLSLATSGSHSGTNCPFQQSGMFLWHDSSAWKDRGEQPPKLGSAVRVPPNSKVLITSCSVRATGVYTKITIPASSQVCKDALPQCTCVTKMYRVRCGSCTFSILTIYN